MQIQRILKTARRYLTDKNYRFLLHAGYGLYNHLPDKEYLSRMYKAKTGKELDLTNPKTFNEKLQWLKLYNRQPTYSIMADKYRMRQFVAEKVGEGYTVPLLGVWDSPKEIDFDALPNRFVLKCNHNSGLGMCICCDKAQLNKARTKRALKKGLVQDYYLTSREWPYKDIPRKIIAEEYLENNQEDVLVDYKFFCFNGIPKIMYISKDNAKAPETDYFDMQFNHLDLQTKDPCAKIPPQKVEQFEEMKRIAKILAENTAHLRVDFYIVNERIYVGELTFFHNAGFSNIQPESWESILGSWITLPEKTCQ